MVKKNEVSVVNDAIQYWKGFTDALKQVNSLYGNKETFEEEYKELYEKSHQLIDDYKNRYNNLKKEQKKEVRKNNEGRKNKRN